MKWIIEYPEIAITLGLISLIWLFGFINFVILDVRGCGCKERDLFCTSNGYAFVKCIQCGAESIPWQVSQDKADQFQIDHPDMYKKLAEIDIAAKLYWSKQ